MLTGDTSTSTLSVLQFQRDLKDEYLRRNGPTGEDTLHGAQQTALAVTKRNSLAQRISTDTLTRRYMGKPDLSGAKCYGGAK
jgi:hypothetical protein